MVAMVAPPAPRWFDENGWWGGGGVTTILGGSVVPLVLISTQNAASQCASCALDIISHAVNIIRYDKFIRVTEHKGGWSANKFRKSQNRKSANPSLLSIYKYKLKMLTFKFKNDVWFLGQF